MQRSKLHSLDELIGAAGQGQRDCDAKRLGRLKVDVQLDLRGPLHRQVSGLLALENAPGIDAGQTVRIPSVRSVALRAMSKRRSQRSLNSELARS